MPENQEGGLGGPAPGIRDTRLHERAIRERWPMPPAVRVKVLQRLVNIVDEDYDHGWEKPGLREVISAARALLSADKLNLEQAKFDHATTPPEATEADYEIDLSDDDDDPTKGRPA